MSYTQAEHTFQTLNLVILAQNMGKLTVLSASPSPCARKVRITLKEKGTELDVESEVPWHTATNTPKYNPIGKLAILIFDNGAPPIYESCLILEDITTKYAGQGPKLMPASLEDQMLARQIQVLADGVCEAAGEFQGV